MSGENEKLEIDGSSKTLTKYLKSPWQEIKEGSGEGVSKEEIKEGRNRGGRKEGVREEKAGRRETNDFLVMP